MAYLLPRYSADESEHFAHIPHLLLALAAHVPLTVVVEKGSAPPHLDRRATVHVLRHGDRSRIRRVLELAGVVRRLRQDGVAKVFVRYSRTAATVILLLRPITGLQLYYWASGQADGSPPTTMRGRLGRWAQDLHFGWIARRADRFLTGPESMVPYMATRWGIRPERMRLLYNDVDPSRFAPPTPAARASARRDLGLSGDDEFLALYVHRVSPRRGSRLLVPTVSRALDEGIAIKLVVVGTGPDLPRLRDDIARTGLDDRILVRGALPNHALAPLYRAADCLLMPSYEEGFPRVVLEAMATGTPVVACDAGGTRDLLPDGYPYVVPVGDVKALVAALRDLAGRTDTGALGASLRARVVDRYSTAAVATMYARVACDD